MKLSRVISLVLSIAVGIVHFWELQGYTRHLTWLEKDFQQVVVLQTENGFYYSYYRELVEAQTVSHGLKRLVWDERSEYPDVLNALRRFNIYQEVFMALTYRLLRTLKLDYVDEWIFVRHNVFILNCFGHAAMSLLAAEVSGNPFAGIACYLLAYLNRFQITRLGNYQSLNLREQYGVPLLWMQTLLLWYILHGMEYSSGAASKLPVGSHRRRLLWLGFATCTFLFIIVWQFSPFLLLLQLTALYFVYLVCGYRGLRPAMVGVLNTYLCCMAVAVVVHFGSPYLLTSPFLYQLIAIKVATCLCARQCLSHLPPLQCCGTIGDWIRRRVVDVVEGLVSLGVFFVVMKAAAPFATADTHIYEILCTKSKDINNAFPERLQLREERLPECADPSFNARLYLVMGVFKTIEEESLNTYKITTASPAAAVTCLLIFTRCALAACRCKSAARGRSVESSNASSVPQGEADSSSTQPKDAAGLRNRKGGHQSKGSVELIPDLPEDEKEHGSNSSLCGEVRAEIAEEAALLFFVLQALLFFLLGSLVNRLRVAFGPMMMVAAVSCCGPRVWPLRFLLRPGTLTRLPLLGVLSVLFVLQVAKICSMLPCAGPSEGLCSSWNDVKNDYGDLIDLMSWINEGFPARTPFLTSMNLAGTMRAFTDASLIVHPQFESENLRKRVQRAYELYHCGSEESLMETMQSLHAKFIIIEYGRCMFTPYTLDDRRKNCNNKKHKFEDLLCVKLHAQSRFFKIAFMNGGYAAFQVRDKPLPLPQGQDAVKKKSPALVASMLERDDTWSEYLEECKRLQGKHCGPRLAEAASTWKSKLQRDKVASKLRHIARDHFPKDGLVAFTMGRYLDYEAEQPEKAYPYYEQAVKAHPNNPDILKDYIMYMDMIVKDQQKLREWLKPRQADRKGRKALLNLQGSGTAELLCEASVSAVNLGMEKWGRKMWEKAVKEAPLSKCVGHNWQLMDTSRKYDDVYTLKAKAWWFFTEGRQTHDTMSAGGPGMRFNRHRSQNFTLTPTSWH